MGKKVEIKTKGKKRREGGVEEREGRVERSEERVKESEGREGRERRWN